MKFVMQVLLVVFCVTALAGPAFANSGPGPGTFPAEILMLVFLVALTGLGGGYAVLDQPVGWAWRIIGAVLIIVVSAEYPAIILAVFGWCIARGVRMIVWGWRSRAEQQRPENLAKANPRRLIPAGALLVVMTVILFVGGFMVDLNASGYVKRGRNAAARADLQNAWVCIEGYFADHQRYPNAYKDAGCPENSKGVELTYRKVGKNGYELYSSYEDGDREYRHSSGDTAVYERNKNEPDGKWQARQ